MSVTMTKMNELEWEDDKVEFWFEKNEIYDTKEKRNNLKRIEKINSLGLGSDNRTIESKLRKHKKDLGWKEPEKRGNKKMRQKEKMKYKNFDLLSGYEDGIQWRIRMRINSKGNINFRIDI